MSLKNKNILIGVSGGIAAYKVATFIGMLKKEGANVKAIMTKNATEFIAPLTLSSLSQNKVIVDMFDKVTQYDTEHITLSKWADLLVVIPATANIIGKIASGIADDMLSTTIMASRAQVLIAPAMNTNMFENKIVQDNIQKLIKFDYKFVMPQKGMLACGDEGVGKLASLEEVLSMVKELVGGK
ncbi:MAG: flavoprotein [Spirochaetales bacterium]